MIRPSEFRDRKDAGKKLAQALERFRGNKNTLVLALPRGGVPVGAEVARGLDLPFDIIIVRKIGSPRDRELALGAVVMGGAVFLNKELIEESGVSSRKIDKSVIEETLEINRRNALYRQGRSMPDVLGREVVLVDDGIATGANMRAAIQAVRAGKPASITVAVPVAPWDVLEKLKNEVDAIVCLSIPDLFFSVGQAYVDFDQIDDDDVINAMWG